jgi:hypothetical protein
MTQAIEGCISACEAARLCRGNRLTLRRRAMRVLSYLRMEIDPDQTDAYEEDWRR